MTVAEGAFWSDLARDLEDPDFLREYVVKSVRIATIDDIVNALEQAREEAGLSKADLARAIHAQPAVVRRLFASGHVNPTLGTLAEVAAALGMRVTLEQLPAIERKVVTEPLLSGRVIDAHRLVAHHDAKRKPERASALAG